MGVRDRDTERRAIAILQHKYSLAGPFVHNKGTEKGEDNGRPDFVGGHDGTLLGIEITDIYDPDMVDGMPLRQHEAEKDAIVRKAREKAIQMGLPPVSVDVIFTGNPPRKERRETDWADTLFEIVRRNCPEPNGEICLGGFDTDDLPDGFHWISVYRSPNKRRHIWNWEEDGDVATEFSAQLQERIDAKALKYRQYRKHCDKCWLVIAAPGDRPSSFYEFTDEMPMGRYRSLFERVFFMDVAGQIVNELGVIHTTA